VVLVWGVSVKFITLDEKKNSRIYNFITINDKDNSLLHTQFENRNGRIFMRAKRRSLQT